MSAHLEPAPAPEVGARIRYPSGRVSVALRPGAMLIGTVPAGTEGTVVALPSGGMGEVGWRHTHPDTYVPHGKTEPEPTPEGATALVHPMAMVAL